MKSKSLFSKFKKALVVTIIFITMAFAMPVKSHADPINDFVDILLYIPDGIMHVIDGVMGGSDEFTSEKLNFKGINKTDIKQFVTMFLSPTPSTGKDGKLYNFIVTPYEIFSSGCYEQVNGKYVTKLGYLDINFFSDKEIVSEGNGTPVSSEILAPVIGNVYKSLRNLCMILMLLVILYIGIKILISSVSEQQAKYKKFLMDWVVGFALLFMMHYIMSGIVNINSLVVGMLSNDEGDSYYVGLSELSDIDFSQGIKGIAESVVSSSTSVVGNDSSWVDVVNGFSPYFGGSLEELKKGVNILGKIVNKKLSDIVDLEDDESDTEIVLLPYKYENFKKNRLIVRGGKSNVTYSDKISANGELDLNGLVNGIDNLRYNWNGNDKDFLKGWGKNGKIYLSASIGDPNGGNFATDFAKAQMLNIVNPAGGPIGNYFIYSKLKEAAGSDEYIKNRVDNKAIVKLNAMSYVRTISSCASEDNTSVVLYQNGGAKKSNTFTTMGYSILYLCLVIETIMFLFVYIKRVLQMAFLTMIAPIVALMYPVDKLGDGKAQAFNTWLKDYIFNVLIQPMHLLLYTVFIVAAGQLVSRNIIYALAIYGFMIPAEKYFKKILGFEKASTGGGGPLGGAIGRGLAMDGLGRLAGIGPAGRGGKGGSGKGDSRRGPRISPRSPSSEPATDRASSVLPSSLDKKAKQKNKNGTMLQNLLNNTGSKKKLPKDPSQLNNSRASADINNPRKSAFSRAVGKRLTKAITGNEYDSLRMPGASAAAGTYLGKKVGKLAARGAGAALMGGVGLVTGAATALATGDVNNLWKGTAVGLGAGNKISSNLFDGGASLVEGFADDMKTERAKVDDDYRDKLMIDENCRRIMSDEKFDKLSTEDQNLVLSTAREMPYLEFSKVDEALAARQIINDYPDATESEKAEMYRAIGSYDKKEYVRKQLSKMDATKNDPAIVNALAIAAYNNCDTEEKLEEFYKTIRRKIPSDRSPDEKEFASGYEIIKRSKDRTTGENIMKAYIASINKGESIEYAKKVKEGTKSLR